MVILQDIDLHVSKRLEDKEFRKEWFRAELESSVPSQFRFLRESRRKTQSELAEATSMKQSAISRFEKSNHAKWKLETLLTLADALDARLTIGLEPAELVLEKMKRLETKLDAPRASVLHQVSVSNLNSDSKLNLSALSEQSGMRKNSLQAKSIGRSENRSWN